MNLFENDPDLNLLLYQGEVNYLGAILSAQEAQHYFETLLKEINWQHDQVQINGKIVTTKRKVAWYGNKNYAYHYSGTTKQANQWTDELLELKSIVEAKTNQKFNSCLLNLYENGEQGMSWHSDDETVLGEQTSIASLSLGEPRKFSFKHKTKKHSCSIELEAGSLLMMQGKTQIYWLHSLPINLKSKLPRINLTFRTITDGRKTTIDPVR
ncbi:alpha-ketoglutarate-dependent dioxygenase AlkB family protein [Marinicellulosiphila megalodicopiae]|uniref:alpha-ketoglutarate-dependent dioxygenase AlkB family protein n=1 Tax=Marinicellulosiphila megalodicopiae TaxID=2724896 RepID=UPI003BAF9C9E